jgi:hypothetical protein
MEKGLGKMKSDLSLDNFELYGEVTRKHKNDLCITVYIGHEYPTGGVSVMDILRGSGSLILIPTCN